MKLSKRFQWGLSISEVDSVRELVFRLGWFCRVRSEPRAVSDDVQGPKVLAGVSNANSASLLNWTGRRKRQLSELRGKTGLVGCQGNMRI